MLLIFKKTVILVLLAINANTATATSCKFGRGACVASCMAQNCATGYCTGVEPNQVCVCSRCNQGPNTPW